MFFSSLYMLLNPYMWVRWKRGEETKKLEKELLEYLEVPKSKIISYYNARSALYHALKLFGIDDGDEVIVQAYTCVSVSNSIIGTGAKPIYVDIEKNSLNIDPDEIKKSITDKTKAVILQHTFGDSAKLGEIKDICNKNKIFLIEDCAHALGGEYKGKKLGTFGDASVFSFGRDKVISSVNGGILVINNSCYHYLEEDLRDKQSDVSFFTIFQNLNYIIVAMKAKILFDIGPLGKIIMMLSRRLRLIPEVVSNDEKHCKDKTFDYAYPNALAYIARKELQKIDIYNDHRKKINSIYNEYFDELGIDYNGAFLRYSIFVDNREEVVNKLKQEKIYLGNWYDNVIAPKGTDFDECYYIEGSCENAEEKAKKSINLPNHIGVGKGDVEKIIGLIRKNLYK